MPDGVTNVRAKPKSARDFAGILKAQKWGRTVSVEDMAPGANSFKCLTVDCPAIDGL